jgi:protein SCO1/2
MWRTFAGLVLAAVLLGASAASAQLANTLGPNPQVLGEDGQSHEHGYGDSAPAPSTLGGAFELVDQNGRTVTDATFRGQWMLVYFGYATCQEACPVALQTMAVALDILGADAQRIQPAFVDFTVVYSRMHHKHKGHEAKIDPVSFASAIHPRMLMLTGTRKNVFSILRNYKVRQEHSPLTLGGKAKSMRIDHTTRIYLVGPDGKGVAYYYHSVDPTDLANDLLLRIGS